MNKPKVGKLYKVIREFDPLSEDHTKLPLDTIDRGTILLLVKIHKRLIGTQEHVFLYNNNLIVSDGAIVDRNFGVHFEEVEL